MKRPRPTSRATLIDVSERAGVSPTTASLVLSGKGSNVRISPETDARVRKAAEDLDYSPNLLVRSLQRGKTQVLAFFSAFRNIDLEDLYMFRLSMGLERAAGEQGYDLLVHCVFNRSTKEMYRFVNGGRADGLVLWAPRADDPILPLLRQSSLPVVLLNSRDPHGVLPSIKDDYASGMKMLGEALLAHGHRNVAGLHVDENTARDAEERFAALRKVLRSQGGDLAEEDIVNAATGKREAIERILRSPNRPTAIFCWHDRLAYEILGVCDSMGLNIPEDISIVGYDGIRWAVDSRHIVTSVEVDLMALTRAGVALLCESIRSAEIENPERTLPVRFVPGTTIGPAKSIMQRSNQ